MTDQKQHWDSIHNAGELDAYSAAPTDFAQEVMSVISPHSKILELGCGTGNDSAGFAKAGHQVLATDFSEVAVAKNQQSYTDIPNLAFSVLDMSQPFHLDASNFDVVYARLSLHYFPHLTTERIFEDIYHVLKPGGYLCFICKSTADALYGQGTQLEPDMFEYKGHVRHFFSEQYAHSLLADRFKVIKMESGEDKLFERQAAFIKVMAQVVKQ